MKFASLSLGNNYPMQVIGLVASFSSSPRWFSASAHFTNNFFLLSLSFPCFDDDSVVLVNLFVFLSYKVFFMNLFPGRPVCLFNSISIYQFYLGVNLAFSF